MHAYTVSIQYMYMYIVAIHNNILLCGTVWHHLFVHMSMKGVAIKCILLDVQTHHNIVNE